MRSASGTVNEWSHGNAKISDKKISDSVIRVMRHKARGIETNHPAVFPVELVSHILESWDGLLYEPFAGSGTSLIAATQLQRTCYAMEISPSYCDLIVKRWEDFTGNTAVCEPSSAHFQEEQEVA